MRLTSDIWVKALVRRVFGDGGFAVVERTGAAEAGVIFIRVLHRDGSQTLLAPAPQSLFDSAKPQDRVFEARIASADGGDVDRLLAREADFDPDFWVVEIETDTPQDYLDIRLDDSES